VNTMSNDTGLAPSLLVCTAVAVLLAGAVLYRQAGGGREMVQWLRLHGHASGCVQSL